MLLAYNPEAAGDNAPADWTDLWTKPEWKGKYFVNLLLLAEQRSLCCPEYLPDIGTITENLASQEGWDAIAAYYQNAYIQQEGDDFFAMLTKGDIWAGQNYSQRRIKGGSRL